MEYFERNKKFNLNAQPFNGQMYVQFNIKTIFLSVNFFFVNMYEENHC